MQKTMQIPFQFTPRPYQIKLYNCIADGYKRAVTVWHRRAGKDKTMINIMAKESLKRVGSYYYFFPSYKQGRKILWDGMDRDGFPFQGHIPKEVREKTNDQEMRIKLKNGSLIQIVGTDDIDAIVGSNPVGCVFSEYALQKPQAWEFIRPILAENQGWAIFNSTPRGLNHFHEIYQTALREKDWFSELLTIEDTGVLTEVDIQKERAEGMSEALIRQEYYCDFTASAENIYIPLDVVLAAVQRQNPSTAWNWAPVVIGVDVARFGTDQSVICIRQGLHVISFQKYRNIDTMELSDRVSLAIREYSPQGVFVDVVGIGAGVVDRLRMLGYQVVEVNAGARPNAQKYKNKRAEMWGELKDWLKTGDIPNDMELKSELSSVQYSFDIAERIQLEKKENMLKRGVHSPDIAEALALTFAYQIDYIEQYDQIANYHHQTDTCDQITGY